MAQILIKHLCDKDGKVYIPLAGRRVDPNKYERLWLFLFFQNNRDTCIEALERDGTVMKLTIMKSMT